MKAQHEFLGRLVQTLVKRRYQPESKREREQPLQEFEQGDCTNTTRFVRNMELISHLERIVNDSRSDAAQQPQTLGR